MNRAMRTPLAASGYTSVPDAVSADRSLSRDARFASRNIATAYPREPVVSGSLECRLRPRKDRRGGMMNKAVLNVLIGIVTLALAVLGLVLPLKARRRHQDVDQVYPAYPFVFPALLAVIAIQQLIDDPQGTYRGVDAFLMACCFAIAALRLWAANRGGAPQTRKRPSIVVIALYGLLALVFAGFTFR